MYWQTKPLIDVDVFIKDVIAIYITNGKTNGIFKYNGCNRIYNLQSDKAMSKTVIKEIKHEYFVHNSIVIRKNPLFTDLFLSF